MDLQNTTRRSFMKKTTALAVGISATTLFSGLVHAEAVSGEVVFNCSSNGEFPYDGMQRDCTGNHTGHTCTWVEHRGWVLN